MSRFVGEALPRRSLIHQGETISYLEAGAGKPLLFLPPSAFLHARAYHRVLQGLAETYRVLAPDLPGTGHSGPREAYWDFERYAVWATGFLETLDIPRALVAGHSTSGGVALTMASRFPEHVERLILADTAGLTGGRRPSRILAARARDSLLEMRFNLRVLPDFLDTLWRHPRTFLHHLHLSTRIDLMGQAQSIRVPTLLAWGERDHTFPLALARQLEAHLLHASLHVSPTGSHDWILLQPEAFVSAVRAWDRAD